MNKQEIINKTAQYARETLEGEGSGHDWWHIYRVWKMAQHIGQKENADMFVVELAALLHDIADWKNHDGNEDVGTQKAREYLESLDLDSEIVGKVCDIIKQTYQDVNFEEKKLCDTLETLETKIVWDADKLDSIGAIGIARSFVFAGNKGLTVHDPSIKHLDKMENMEVYKNFKRPTYTQINHFYEKLLLIKDLMNTKTGKEIAQGRHVVMENFLKEFFDEWEGRA